jgi:apolipoprotein N-acyltransferase
LKNKYIYTLLVSSFLLGIAQHVSYLGFLAWFCLVPLFAIFHKLNSYKQIIFYSFVWGIGYHLTTMFWLSSNIGTDRFSAIVSMIVCILYLSTNTILFGVMWYRLKTRYSFYSIPLLIVVWTVVEFIKSYGILPFPWVSIANTQTEYFHLIQIVEYFGIYGITFWLLSINGILFSLYQYNVTYKKILYGIVVFAAPFFIGYLTIKKYDLIADDYKISLIQPNINLYDSRDFSKRYILLDNLIKKSKISIDNGAKLIIWPEAALPFHSLQNKNTFNYINKNLLDGTEVSILSGDITFEKDNTYNSVVLFNKDGVVDIYKKQLPVPLAEQVPLSDTFPKLKKINIGVANYSSGNEDVVFSIDNQNFSSLICYESTFPEINRRHVKKGADFITFLVNDAWYTKWPEPRQHAKQSIYRAVENRRTVLRCANTGISLIIDPLGRIIKELPLNKEGELSTYINKVNRTTFYTKFGNVFCFILLIIIGLLLIRTFVIDEKDS